MAARMYMCRGACTCIHSAVPESAMPTRRSRGGHHDIHVQTCTCIHSTVHESTMPTRRSRDDHRYVCTCAGVHMHTQRRAQRPHTYEAKASEDGGRYEHVQTCTCIHSTVHESPMPTRRSRDGSRYADVQACSHMHTDHRAQGHYAYEAKASGGGSRYVHVQTCIHSTVRESAMPTRLSRDGGRYVHVQTCTSIHRPVPREHYAYEAKPRWR